LRGRSARFASGTSFTARPGAILVAARFGVERKRLACHSRPESIPTYRVITDTVSANVRKSGAYRDRTGDLRLAKPALSQLS
jgi:hypothetical protein